MRLAVLSALSVLSVGSLPAQSPTPPQHVVLIMIDGLRWQEVFSGADSLLLFSHASGSSESVSTYLLMRWNFAPIGWS